MDSYRTVASDESKPDWYGAIRQAVAYIDAHFAEPLALPDLARVSGMSESSFRRTFKRLRRQTPAQYRRAHFSA